MVKAPYIATYSDSMRIALKIAEKNGLNTINRTKQLVEDAVNTIVDNEEIAQSLKKENCSGIFNSLRQIDMKSENNEVILKTFTKWNTELKCWHVFIEFPFEEFWENKTKTIGKG